MNTIKVARCDEDHVGHFFFNYMRNIPNEICQEDKMPVCSSYGGMFDPRVFTCFSSYIFYSYGVHYDKNNYIDAVTDREETCGSVLSRSIHLAQTFRKLGLVPGDTIIVAARNHLDVHIPFYAAMMTGVPVAGIDPSLEISGMKHLFKIIDPKLAFCDSQYIPKCKQALQELNLDTKIVSFDGGEFSFGDLMSDQDLPPESEFQVSIFNTAEIPCWLCSTSGSTGRPKIVAIPHSNIKNIKFFRLEKAKNGERRTALNLSGLYWISGCFNALLLPVNHIKLQTSAPMTTELVIDIINKYKPAGAACTPNFLNPILHHKKHCDLTCFDILKIGGSKVHGEFLTSIRIEAYKKRHCFNTKVIVRIIYSLIDNMLHESEARLRKDALIHQAYGITEVGVGMITSFSERTCFDERDPDYEIKLLDPETEEEILEPNVTGVLAIRGPTISCYYKDQKSTEAALTEEGFFKTGDLFYKDEHGHYFFVERLKMLIKYRNYQVVPSEIEDVILTHEGISDVCVTSMPDMDDGELVVACVVRRQGAKVTAQEIKNLVADHLTDSKRLRGGVVFLDTLPTTSSGKIARMELKKFVLTAHRE